MLVDPSEWEVGIELLPFRNFDQFEAISDWCIENNIKYALSYGILYFKSEEEAILFKLRFGIC